MQQLVYRSELLLCWPHHTLACASSLFIDSARSPPHTPYTHGEFARALRVFARAVRVFARADNGGVETRMCALVPGPLSAACRAFSVLSVKEYVY